MHQTALPYKFTGVLFSKVHFFLLFVFLFETRFYYIALAGLELVAPLQPPPLESWD